MIKSLELKKMGVMNLTPNSFSDGGEIPFRDSFNYRLHSFGNLDAIDIGAESTAPMNEGIAFDEEWRRLEEFLPLILKSNIPVSLDTYHLETIERLAIIWLENKISVPLIWNDVSGKFDQGVKDFLGLSENFHYVYCHNLAPSREESIKHMDYTSLATGDDFLDELKDHFSLGLHPRVILDPTLGFSKTFEQNWYILEHFRDLQMKVGHGRWLLGFSRKSFLKKKFNTSDKEELDRIHGEVLKQTLKNAYGEIWIRTHRPELLNFQS